jgi:2-oxo-4-hydroxy-4-carboxy-5-ureidoimidazoline decarboxylase
MASEEPLGITGFNQLSEDVGLAMLLGVCASAVLGQRLLQARPFSDIDDVIDRASEILLELPEEEVQKVLEGHPRIGGKVGNPSSAREQAAVSDAARDVREKLADGNRAYEYKFGHVYLVFASGRSAEELLAILTARLSNDPATEWNVMLGELAKINRLRLTRMLTEPIADAS